jgi:triacylglycerol lipase
VAGRFGVAVVLASDVARNRFYENGGFDDGVLIDQEGTQCYIAWTSTFVIVAFRGTQPDERVDILHDVEFPLTAFDTTGENVHEGFKEGLDVAWDAVEAQLRKVGGRSVWFAGHSLGAALATLAADRLLIRSGQRAGVYTLGSPRVGDRAFVNGFNARHGGRAFRYVNHHDLVTHLPPESFGFGHVDREEYIDADGTSTPGTTRPGIVALLNDAATHWGRLEAILSGASLLPGFLIDHTPRRYATCLWNALIAALPTARP